MQGISTKKEGFDKISAAINLIKGGHCGQSALVSTKHCCYYSEYYERESEVPLSRGGLP